MLGANLIVSSSGSPSPTDPATGERLEAATARPALMDEKNVLDGIGKVPATSAVVLAPFVYFVARASGEPVVVAGTWLDVTHSLEPSWALAGNWVASREDAAHCLVGRRVAQQFRLAPGDPLKLDYAGRVASLSVSGIVDSGGPDDNQVFVNLRVAQALTGLPGKIELVEFSATGTVVNISGYAKRLAEELPGYDVRPIRQVTEAGGELLNRTRLLIVSMVLLILVLTTLCVLATMSALAMERREDVGLMKALGGSISRIVLIFLSEAGVLAATGGLLGCLAGFALSRWMGERVFSASIAPRWEVVPLTIGLMVLVALTGGLPLRLLGDVKPAAILRGE